MTPLESPGPKIGGGCKQRAIIFDGSRVIGYCFEISIGCNAFLLKIGAQKIKF